jgi:hypothetical protein
MNRKVKFDPHTGELKQEKKNGCVKTFFKIILWFISICIVIMIIAKIIS